MLRSLLPAVAAGLIFAAPAIAGDLRDDARTVVELFTSQGCSSCPQADAMFDEIGKRPGVVALAYHVDYWDYTGWTDTFGAKANTDRQRDYARSWGSASIYTPQLVVNGRQGVVGSRRNEVDAAMQTNPLMLPVRLTTDNGMLEVTAPPDPTLADAEVWLVTFLDHAKVDVQRGENQGKSLGYSQIVTGRQVLGMWDAKTGAHLKLPISEVLTGASDGAVILVQQEKNGLPGPILGAASFTR